MKRNRLLAGIFGLVIVLPLAWWLGSPLFIDREVAEGDPFGETMVEERSADPTPNADPTTLEGDSAEMQADSADVTSIATGMFIDADSAHRGSGTATILQRDDRRVLRFTDFEVTNGPDLHVYLVKNIAGRSEDTFDDYIDLGSLKGNIGEQNYEISADVDLSEYNGVIIYCQPFHVTFSIAEFTP